MTGANGWRIASGRGIESRLARLARSAAALPNPGQRIDHALLRLDSEMRALIQAAKGLQNARLQRLKQTAALLESFSYQRVLERGFVLVSDNVGNILASVEDVMPGTGLSIKFFDGHVSATVSGKSSSNPEGKPKPRRRKKKDNENQGSLI